MESVVHLTCSKAASRSKRSKLAAEQRTFEIPRTEAANLKRLLERQGWQVTIAER